MISVAQVAKACPSHSHLAPSHPPGPLTSRCPAGSGRPGADLEFLSAEEIATQLEEQPALRDCPPELLSELGETLYRY